MLYAKEHIWIQDQEREIFIYLKKTRNHSYRISADKISITLPQIYRNHDVISKHKNELIEKIKERIASEPHLAPQKKLFDDSRVSILGTSFAISRTDDERSFRFDPVHLTITLTNHPEKNKQKLISSLSAHFQPIIEHRIRNINQHTVQKNITSVLLKNNQSSWGLCSTRGEITLSISALFLPTWVLDYIVVHELCHLVHHDHSPSFWKLVETYFPKYKRAKKFLKEHGFNYHIRF